LEFTGYPIQVLLFFSNLAVPLGTLDPFQLMLVRNFKEKATRLGVLSHTYNTLDEFRRRFRLSLNTAYEKAVAIKDSKFQPKKRTPISQRGAKERIVIGDFKFMKTMAPQWADYRSIPLVEYRGASIVLRGSLQTLSPYFRFGFKYCDIREPPVSSGSIQTQGQNILVHVGKNLDKENWFLTAYRAGYRLGKNETLNNLDLNHPVRFSIEIASAGMVALTLNDVKVYETFFQVDGLCNLILLAWGDEHEYECTVTDLELEIIQDRGDDH
jgi:hypothetical protein